MRTQLLAVVLIPIITALVLGGLRIGSAVQNAQDIDNVRQLVRLVDKSTGLLEELEDERDLTAFYVAAGRTGDTSQLDTQRSQVDAALARVRAEAAHVHRGTNPVLATRLTALDALGGPVTSLRDTVDHSKMRSLAVVNAYTALIAELTDALDLLTPDIAHQTLAVRARALQAFAKAAEQASRQRALLGGALTEGHFDASEAQSLTLASVQQQALIREFRSGAPLAQRQFYERTVNGRDVDRAEILQKQALTRQGTSRPRLDAGEWFETMTSKLELMRLVEKRLVGSVEDESSREQHQAERSVFIASLVMLLILLLAFGVTRAVVQSMVAPLHALRASALDITERRLPEAVRLLRVGSSDAQLEAVKVEPTSVNSTDEIGGVAHAFNDVYREAVRLAFEQAQLRGRINAMFVNLSQRSQYLVERQLELIDRLENGEQDPDLLASLFKLDHLATRMRRNGENLLVLAGEEAGRRWTAPVRLVDVLRAATSEVEQYQRVQLRGLVTADVDGRAVNDIVHLIAELLENATAFSSPDTEVLVTSQLLSGGGAKVEIQDSGIGMSAKDLEEANERLLNPPVVDVSVARRMGMFVVGQLSGRHGIRVQLRRSSTCGITSVVMLPQKLVREHGDHMDPPGLSARYNSDGRLTGWRNYDTTEQLNDSGLAKRTYRTRRQGARSAGKEKGLPRPAPHHGDPPGRSPEEAGSGSHRRRQSAYPQAPHAGTEAETRHHVLDTSMSGDSLNFEDRLLNSEAVESEQFRRRHAAPSVPAPTELTEQPQLATPAPPAPPDTSAEGASHRPR
ncbi:nitrate- and nitrite sensing domain-containing protein [Streptomyces sp. NBC_00322]|uniref:sensor histidine kinase n=1 Tax=Streptomyces sp. NBC_00322 TaxID=2975712 RepID=UPI002E2D6304|nr:nitrate- and nitrite sensing domain-containing protein [Streptomyces sp. NBC_00322]